MENAVTAAATTAFCCASPMTNVAELFQNPISMDPEHITCIQRDPFSVSVKADGVRCVLFLLTNANSDRCAVLLLRSGAVFSVRASARDALWTGAGSVFDCELVIGLKARQKSLVLCAFDSPMIVGECICGLSLKERRELLLQAVQDMSLHTASGSEIQVLRKPAFTASAANVRKLVLAAKSRRAFMDASKTVCIPCDGIIFASVADQIFPTSACRLFKVKEHYSIDLMLIARPGEFCAAAPMIQRVSFSGQRPHESAPPPGGIAAALQAATAFRQSEQRTAPPPPPQAASTLQCMRWSARMQYETTSGPADLFHSFQFAGIEFKVAMEPSSMFDRIFQGFEDAASAAMTKIRSRADSVAPIRFQCVVECFLRIDFVQRIIHVRIAKKRRDKKRPNDLSTLLRVVGSAQCNLDLDAVSDRFG